MVKINGQKDLEGYNRRQREHKTFSKGWQRLWGQQWWGFMDIKTFSKCCQYYKTAVAPVMKKIRCHKDLKGDNTRPDEYIRSKQIRKICSILTQRGSHCCRLQDLCCGPDWSQQPPPGLTWRSPGPHPAGSGGNTGWWCSWCFHCGEIGIITTNIAFSVSFRQW